MALESPAAAGAGALRPGILGLSEGIRVVATVGRHFETSRVFAFGSGQESSVFISSGDLGPALDRQVDVAAPVEDPAHAPACRPRWTPCSGTRPGRWTATATGTGGVPARRMPSGRWRPRRK